ncbi:MFS transporter [Streptomyces sp. NPDC057654]|uniref:MFS transporter n=1 Tax=Streptomyces sp. NPDC057654 TaxID=3346196 RepID=UPI00368DAADB
MTPVTPATPRPTVPVRRLWAAVLCGYMALGATLQSLPSYVVGHFHGGPLIAGTVVGIAFLATACARPFAGRLADAGFARPVVATGGVLGAIGGAGHLIAPNPGTLIVARLVMGVGEAALFSGAIPWVLADTPPQRRGRVAGWFGLSMWGGLALGPVVAVGLNHLSGYRGVWWGVIVLGIVSAVLVLTTGGDNRNDDGLSPLPKGFREIVPVGASLPGLAFGLSSYGYGTVNALLVLHLHHDGIGGESAALAVFAAGFLLARALGSPLVDRKGGVRVALGSLVVEAVGLLLIAGTGNEVLALAGTVLAGAGVALMYPATVAMTLHRTGALRPGTSVGVMTSYWDLGIMAAGPLGGLIAGHAGYTTSFAVAAVTTVLSLLVVATALRTPAPAPAPAPAPKANGSRPAADERSVPKDHGSTDSEAAAPTSGRGPA